MMGIGDWLFRRSIPRIPQPPSREHEERRRTRERREDERVRAQVRAQLRALDERMELIARERNGH